MNTQTSKKLLCVISLVLMLVSLSTLPSYFLLLLSPSSEGAMYLFVMQLARCVLLASGAILLYKERPAARWIFLVHAVLSAVAAVLTYVIYAVVYSAMGGREAHAEAIDAMQRFLVWPATIQLVIAIVLAVFVHRTLMALPTSKRAVLSKV